jgi:hypothetical protein
MNKIKVTIIVGCGLRKDKTEISLAARKAMLEAATLFLLANYGAYTLSEVQGGWRDETGHDWIESGYSFSFTTEEKTLAVAPAHWAAALIRDIFDQQCVVLETSEVNFELI